MEPLGKKVVTVRIKGRRGKFLTKIPKDVINLIACQPDMLWFDVEDLTSTIKFFDYPHFWAGKIDVIKEVLRGAGYEVKVKVPKLSKQYEWTYTGDFRKGQDVAVKALIKNRRGLFQATTGTGKTHVIAATVAELGVPTLIVIYNAAPGPQMFETFENFTNVDYGVWAEGRADNAPVIIANIQTIGSILKQKKSWRKTWLLETMEAVFFDEAHKSAAPVSQDLIREALNLKYLYGTTATRRKDDKTPIFDAMYGTNVHKISYGETIESGTSVPITVTVIEVPPKDYGYSSQKNAKAWHRRNQYMKVVNDYVVNGATGRNKIIVQQARRHMEKGRTVLISVNKVDHAYRLHQMIKGSKLLVASAPYAVSSEEREEILESFRNREFQCLVSTLVKEAVDIPSLDTVILAMGGKSEVLFEQSLRNTRQCDRLLTTGHYKKKRGYVIYLRDQADFLKSHSGIIERLLRKIVAQSPKNKIKLPQGKNGKNHQEKESIRRVHKRVQQGKRSLTEFTREPKGKN